MERSGSTREEIEKEIGASFEAIASIGPRGLYPRELESLYVTACEINPKVIVEIGALHGVSSVVLGCVAKRCGGMLYSIECRPHPRWHINMREFGVAECAELVEAASPDVDVAALAIQAVDYLLIDGGHSYEDVLADYCFWSELMIPGGRIALHDYFSIDRVRRAIIDILERDADKLKQVTIVPGRMYNSVDDIDPDLGPGLIVLEKC